MDASAWYARLHAEPRLGAAERAQVLAELLVLCDEEARSAPLSGSAHLIKSKVMAEELGDLAAAQECARRAVELEPERPQLRFDYVRLLIFRAEYNAAWDALRSYLLRRINERGGWSGQDVGLYDVALLMLGILCGYLMHGNDDDIDIWRELPVAFMRLDRAVAAAVADRLSVTFNFARTVVLIGAQHSVGVRTPRESASVVILGDSHILPLAWRTVNDKQLVPMLSMGLKAFHFSSASGRARERAILSAHLAALPPSASLCIVSCGEIDCRPNHGIHLALARGVYSSLEEAVRVLADGVVERLEATEWTGRFLIHPVRPPIRLPSAVQEDATPAYDARDYISALNAAFRARCEGAARVAFMDFGDALASSSGFLADYFQRPGDEVHMKETYLPFLADEMA